MSTIITKKRSTLSNLSKSAYYDMYKSSILTVASYSLPVLSNKVSGFLTQRWPVIGGLFQNDGNFQIEISTDNSHLLNTDTKVLVFISASQKSVAWPFLSIFTVQLLSSFVTVSLFESVTDCDGDVSHLIKETVINHPEPHHLITNINR